MRRFLLLIGLSGTLLFGTAFVLSWLNPLLIEQAAREIVRIEIERRVGAHRQPVQRLRADFAARPVRVLGQQVRGARLLECAAA